MRAIDLVIIFGYLIGIVLFGAWFARKQKTTSDYFLGDRSVPWWAVAASIVATETSTITFISVPGIAFARGWQFPVSAARLRLLARTHRNRPALHSFVFPRRIDDRLPASRSPLRRQDQSAGGVAVRRHAQYRRRNSTAADCNRARRRLHIFSAQRECGNDHHRLDSSDRRWR